MLSALKQKGVYVVFAVAALLLLASTPVVVPAAFANECPGAGQSGSC